MQKLAVAILGSVLWTAGARLAAGEVVLREVEIGPARFEVVELARTPQERAQGLQGRRHLPDSAAMAFLSLPPRPQVFWMKNTLVPLDILFLDARGSILQITSMEVEEPRREGESEGHYLARLKRYPCRRPVFCALEIRGGLAAELGLQEGERIPALSWEALKEHAIPEP